MRTCSTVRERIDRARRTLRHYAGAIPLNATPRAYRRAASLDNLRALVIDLREYAAARGFPWPVIEEK